MIEVSNNDTLILSNISETLYKPCNIMSDKKWRTYVADRVREIISDPALAAKIANRIENIIVNQVDKELVYENAPQVIDELQSKKIPMIAISMKSWSTSYDPYFGITTSNHLKKLEIDLEKSVPLIGKMKNNDASNYEQIQEIQNTDDYTFAKGIIFTNKKPLDKALDSFLNRLEKKPSHIVILENSFEHKNMFEAVLKAHNIMLTFIKHTPAEAQEEPLDSTLGIIEFLQFMKSSKIISDEEAKIIKNDNSFVDYESQLKGFIKENISYLNN